MTIPEWVQDAIFYQIFPDRFRNGDTSNDPPLVLPWNRAATPKGFHGGDLAGVTHSLDYLLDLGVNAIYLNPIFLSPTNHRYNTVDYYRIDPKLGSLSDFQALIREAHRREMRVVLDGVFNHCGRGFFAFNDILENGEYSPYLDWFHIKHLPVDAYSQHELKDYEGWWNYKSLPKFNTANPKVREYVFGVARYWIDQGADGWRLDVPNEIDDDGFWAEFRQVVRGANPDAYLLGEIWDALPRWVGENHFDGLMNYPFRTATLGLLAANWTPERYASFLSRLVDTYTLEHNLAMYTLLGSHDVERVRTVLEGDTQMVKLASLIQFGFPGAPAIYYGDEIGLEGGKDPGCRGGFPWDSQYWDTDLRAWFQRLARTRKQSLALRRGDFQILLADDDQHAVAFARRADQESVAVVMNASALPRSVSVPVGQLGWADGYRAKNLLDADGYTVQRGELQILLPAWGGAWLC
jgi:glycosidase